jgi:hypothetical protein
MYVGVSLFLSAGSLPARSQTATKPSAGEVPAVARKDKVDQAPETIPEPAKPFNLAVTYYLFSDYVFRGVNYSEFRGEGREKVNHQLTPSIDVPLGKDGTFGTFGFDTFFEWYAGQEELNGNGTNFQEVDFTLRYSYNVDPIKTKMTVGWTDFTYPHVKGSLDRTNEWFIRLEHNDAWMWRWAGYRGKDGILNPSFFFSQDTGYIRGTWYEIGLSHPFELARNLTWTPKCTFAFDGGYVQPALNGGKGSGEFEYAYTQPGMELKYDLTELLHLPKSAGSVYVSGQLYYNIISDVERERNRSPLLRDLLFGGMTVGWSW